MRDWKVRGMFLQAILCIVKCCRLSGERKVPTAEVGCGLLSMSGLNVKSGCVPNAA